MSNSPRVAADALNLGKNKGKGAKKPKKGSKEAADVLSDEESRAFTLALQQRVGGDGGAHFHRADLFRRDIGRRGDAEALADTLKSGVVRAFRVVRQQLARAKLAVGRPRPRQ